MEKTVIIWTSAEFAKRMLKIKMLQFCTPKCFWISIPKTIIFSQNQWNEKKKRTKLHRELD